MHSMGEVAAVVPPWVWSPGFDVGPCALSASDRPPLLEEALSGVLALDRSLGRGGVLAAAMYLMSLTPSWESPLWALRIQGALIERSGDRWSWPQSLARRSSLPGHLCVRMADIQELWSWLWSRIADDDPQRGVLSQKALAVKLRLLRAAPSSMLSVWSLGAELEGALARVPGGLLEGRAESSWEHQRSGFLGHPALTGDLFGPLLLVEWMASTAPVESADLLARVVRSREPEGLRYYRGCQDLPHDVDDAAALVLASRACPEAPIPEVLMAEARRVLTLAVEAGGRVRTWVDLAEGRPLVAGWFGPECVAVAARAVRALGTFDPERAHRAGRWLAARAEGDGGWRGVHYPSRVITTAMVVQALRGLGLDVERGERWLRDAQRPDGRLGETALETALALSALLEGGGVSERVLDGGVASLLAAQRWDGLWPAGALYVCPHPDGALRPFGAESITTGACVLAGCAARRVYNIDPPGATA